MSLRLVIRRFLLICVILLLLWLSWEALSGSVRQFSPSNTFGQQVETIIQIGCGLLSLLTAFTCCWGCKWASTIQKAWAISLVLVAGLSSLVWGPSMPLTALVFASVALLLAIAVIWGLRRLDECHGNAVE